MTEPLMNPITEDDIANYLAITPDFFSRHATLLATVQLSSGHGTRAVSLQERQAEMLRDKIKVMEHRTMDMIRHGNENMLISDKLHRWVLELLLRSEPGDLPDLIAREIKAEFVVSQVSIKVWDVASAYADRDFAKGVSDDAKALASSLTAPYCGINAGFEAVSWLGDPAAVSSLALIPLRAGTVHSTVPAFGMLVLASPDPLRFDAGMGTDFLDRIGELSSAALSRLR